VTDSTDTQGLEGESLDTSAEVIAEPDQQVETPPDSSGGNPAWQPLRQKLDPLTFKMIEEDLKSFDASAQSRITQLNKQFAPFKGFIDSGQTEQSLQQAVLIAQQINDDPVGFHEKLSEYLRVNGKMPETPQEIAEMADTDFEDQSELPEDPRIAQLEAQNEQITQFLRQQEQDRIRQTAESDIKTEIEGLKQAHPEFSEADIKEVISRTAFMAHQNLAAGNRKIPTLEEGAAEYLGLRNRLLTTPRAGDSAPKLLPTSGGVPSVGGQQPKLGDLSRGQTQDLLAGLINQSKG
jgi:hypothetical protein